ncbi:hypothetical protein FRC12_004650 [Ceratobasidium sp. 428]|nr:hypothetical protein FRC12_004650 [Ceratobasidium sp. 428]
MSGTRLLAVPELLRWVLSNLSVAELAPLLGASCAFLEAGSQLVWKELHDPLPLFAPLLKPSDSPRAEHEPLKITIPNKVDRKVWQRFRLYASCVRKLTNYGRSMAGPVEWHGLEKLRSFAPITPNVRVLWLTWRAEDPVVQPYWDMIWLFLGSATTSLRCHGDWSRGSSAEPMTSVLERARDVRSALVDLTLSSTALISREELRALESRLQPFSQVCTLRLNTSMIDGAIMSYIRRLPNLRTLTLSDPRNFLDRAHRWKPLPIEQGWTGEPYPSLNSVCLSQFGGRMVERLLAGQPSLLRNVTSLNLEMHCGTDRAAPIRSLCEVFRLVANTSRSLHDLTVEWSSSMEVAYRIPAQALAVLFPLHLRRLTLHYIRLNKDSLGISEIQGEWPALTHLILPHQPAWPTDLVQLAQRKTLRVLSVDIKPPRQIDSDAMADTHPSPRPVAPFCLKSQFNLGSVGLPQINELARPLFKCWPDLTLEWHGPVSGWSSIEEPTREGLELLMQGVEEARSESG